MSGATQDIKVEQYDPARGSVFAMTDYSMKWLEDLPVKEAEWQEVVLSPRGMRKYRPSKLAKTAGRDYKLGPTVRA